MAEQYGVSEAELAVVRAAAARRAAGRREYLKQAFNPHRHSAEAGYLFDPAIQRYMSMTATQYEYFQPNLRSSLFGLGCVVLPMVVYGYFIWNDRNSREQKIRSGELRYRDRSFKFQ